MLAKIPETKAEFKKALKKNFVDAGFKTPEENLQWHRTMQTLQRHMPAPAQDWEFKVLSIFTMHPIEALRRAVAFKN